MKDCHGSEAFRQAAGAPLEWNHIIYAAAAATNRRSGVLMMVVVVVVVVMPGAIVMSMVMSALRRLVLVEVLA